MPTVVQVFQPRIGGVPRYVLDLTRELLERTWTVLVVGPPDDHLVEAFAAVGATYVPFPVDVGRDPSPRDDVLAVRTIARVCRTHRPSVLHAHSTKAGIVAGIAGRIAGVPTIYTPHAWSFQMEDQSRLRHDLLLLSEGFMSRAVHREVIAICAAERDAAVLARVVRGRRISIARTGHRPADGTLSRAEARRRLGLADDGTVVAWIGRHGAQKQPGHVAHLASALGSDATVVALGSDLAGSPEGAAIRAAGGRVLPESASPHVLRSAADVYVQTSAWEGLPLTVLEAAGQGLPVVSYDVGGIREQVRDGETGYLVGPDELDALQHRVGTLVRDAALRRTMGDAARSHVRRSFPVDGMLDGIETRYRAVAGQPRSRTVVGR